jgi:flagellar biosynthesis anti-sigma factor FlgM
MDALSNSPSSATNTTKTGSGQNATSAYSSIGALADTQDTASISAAPGQLSGDLPIRQDRVDALRAQVDSGTYTVDSHAVANAMFQNLFRS